MSGMAQGPSDDRCRWRHRARFQYLRAQGVARLLVSEMLTAVAAVRVGFMINAADANAHNT